MRVEKDSNIINTPWIAFYPTDDMTPDQIARLEQFQRIVFAFEEFAVQKAWDFFKEAVLHLLPNYDVHMVFSENLPQKKTRVRSHKKMFYPIRDAIDASDRFDAEVDTGQDQSVLVGRIKLTSANLDFCVDHLINSTFQFVYVVKRNTPADQINWDAFVKKMVDGSIRSGNMLYPNIPGILTDHVGKDRALIMLKNTGRDEETVQFFLSDKGIQSVLDELEAKYRAEVEN